MRVIQSGKLDVRLLQLVEQTLSAAVIADLHNTPFNLVPNLGVGVMAEIDHIVVLLDAGETPYNSVGLDFKYVDGATAAASVTSFINGAVDQIALSERSVSNSLRTDFENKAIQVSTDGDAGAGDGVIRLKVYYRHIETGF